jgi:hypothetical protein
MLEIWKSIEGYEGKYEVSNLGRVKSLQDNKGRKREQIVVVNIANNGYLYVNLWKTSRAKSKRIHRLVADAFCEKKDGADIVNHIDNNPSNNRADNLEWTTYKGNMQHAAKQGRMHCHLGNLAKAQESKKIPVIAISQDGTRQQFESGVEAARILGITRGHISACCRQEYGYKTVGGYRFEYADQELQAKQKPNKQGKSKEVLREELRQKMLGNKLMVGKSLSDETKLKLAIANGREIQQIDKTTGKVIATFPSANSAKKQTGINHIYSCANGTRETAGGYIWRYTDGLQEIP